MNSTPWLDGTRGNRLLRMNYIADSVVVKEYGGLEITDDDAKQILAISEKDKDNPYNSFGEILSAKYTFVGWASHGHVGGDVPLYAFGPGRPMGLVDAPDIGRISAAAMDINLDTLNSRLFVEAGRAFGDGNVTLDKTDKKIPL